MTVAGAEIAAIGRGLLILLGVAAPDTLATARWMAEKIAGLRIFEDENRLMNLSAVNAGGEVLLVSQFTLLGDARKGNRPSFAAAAAPDLAQRLYLEVAAGLRGVGLPVQTGEFGATMSVSLTNDGPVTIILDSVK